ncbi:hypothetical protein PC9H_005777 [Pleurotus ostreatus]|nr:uncharacterized protein PC9H_005777 [Pleurotus ostreatus]KAF7433811.1 hypothetical protein PC9H_005777 [Pleurotus ostreatus]
MNIVYSGDVLPRRGFFKSWERTRHSREVHWFVECFAEALGVFLYTWAGVGATAAFVVGNILGLENVGSVLGIGFAGFPPLKAARYIVFQIFGGYIACLLVYAQWRDMILAAEAALTAAGRLEEVQFTAMGTGGILALYAPPGAHLGLTFVNEFVTDFVLALAIWACLDPTNALVPPQAAPWVISFAYAMAIWGFATPGLAANAARDLGGRFAAMSLYGTKASGGAYAAIAALTSIPATLLAAFTYETANGDKEKNDKSPKKLGVSGWVGWGKKTKDFSTLDGDEMTEREAGDNDKQVHHKASSSSFSRRFKDSLSTTSPKVPPRVLKTPSQHDLKTVRALYDFNGSSDELSFKVGDEIVVVNEVLEEWWMGELGGRKGLFPTSYTTVVPATQSRKPSPPLRNPLQKSPKTKRLSISSEEGAVQRPLIHDASEASELEDEEHILSGRLVSSASPFYLPGANNDSSGTEDDDLNDRVAKWKHDVNGGSNDSLSHAKATVETTSSPFHPQPPLLRRADTSSGIKKTPPPPPPPRRHSTNLLTSPPLPPRKPASTSSSSMLDVTPNASNNNVGYDVSPFESTSELAGCSQFRQNPFKPKGTCSNCFQFHHDF